jgi:hypothetical protein
MILSSFLFLKAPLPAAILGSMNGLLAGASQFFAFQSWRRYGYNYLDTFAEYPFAITMHT